VVASNLRNRSAASGSAKAMSMRKELLGDRNGDNEHSSDSKQLLDHNKQIQEDLTDELANMAESLKNSSLQFEGLLKKDEAVRYFLSNYLDCR
jgi:hypothetical protein